jgi:hypothetical protein
LKDVRGGFDIVWQALRYIYTGDYEEMPYTQIPLLHHIHMMVFAERFDIPDLAFLAKQLYLQQVQKTKFKCGEEVRDLCRAVELIYETALNEDILHTTSQRVAALASKHLFGKDETSKHFQSRISRIPDFLIGVCAQHHLLKEMQGASG